MARVGVSGGVLGYHYGDSPVVVADGTTQPQTDPVHDEPTARPGARLPHQWLPDGRSVFDALGPDLTLLLLNPEADPSAFVAAAADRDTPLRVLDLCMLGCNRTELAERYGATMLLTRPDQHVAWRSTATSVDESAARRVLDQATGRLRVERSLPG